MSLPTTAVVHNWRRLKNKSGLYPVYLRITIDRIQKYETIPVPTKISKEQWIGEDDNWVRDDHPFFFEINTKIREQKQAIQNLIKRYYLEYASKVITDPWVFDRKVFLTEPAYNRQLKQIALKGGISKLVSNKVARHTNAQLWIRLGTNRPVVSRMLGHSKEETTKHYYKVDINEVIDGTNYVDFGKLGI